MYTRKYKVNRQKVHYVKFEKDTYLLESLTEYAINNKIKTAEISFIGAVQNLNVTFALDRSGLVGEDGPTHSGNYDIAYLRCIPNMIICTPADENETRLMLSTGFNYKGPASIRYPRGVGPNVEVDEKLDTIEIGKARVINEAGKDKVILNFGSLLHIAREISENLNLLLLI